MPAFEDDAEPANGAQAKHLREALPTFVRCGACRAMLTPGDTSCPACGAVVTKAEKTLPEWGASAPHGEGEPPTGTAGRKVWSVAAVLVIAALALAAWLLLPTQPQPAEVAAAVAEKPAAQQTAASSTPLAQSLAPNEQVQKPAEPEPVSALLNEALDADQKAHLDELVKREAERAERTRQELKRLAAQEKAAKEARAAKAQERRRAEEEAQAKAQANSAAPSATAAASPEPPAPAPTPAKVSVEQACAHTTNFLSRDLCRIDACRKPTNAKDPICVWFRQIEEDRRRQLGN